ncbi:protein of unknown function [Sterolibacterium denitrificans]|uniref:Uncharacterized protein n=1 Tax=Sterolibacterium denitrificans TaxID=157592 RepID=A0A7Z7HQZ4_9PROT|nr:protein of unknown function [Sterolibacterium denitrificans]
MMRQGELPGSHEPVEYRVAEMVGAMIEVALDSVGEFLFFRRMNIHGVIPFDLSAAARVCVAREQCVFTLPSVQPMTVAVSAISMPSQ